MTLVLNGTTGVSAVDGTASSPAIQGNDSNTGIFFPAADTIAFTTNGTEDMRIDSVGNVGIGTSSPGLRLDVAGGDSSTFDQSISGGRSSSYAGSLLFKNSYWNSGAFGAAAIRGLDSGSSGGLLAFYTTTNGGGTTGVPTERARIDSSGNLLVGTTSGAGRLRVVNSSDPGGSVIQFIEHSSNSDSLRIDANTAGSAGTSVYVLPVRTAGTLRGGIQWNGSNLLYNTSSDYRLKEEIKPMTGALARVSALKPCTYKWKETGIESEGFIAHELQQVAPQCVAGEKDAVDAEGNPQYQGIDTSFLVATLTAAIQELKAELDTVKTELAALKGAQA